MSKRLVNPVNEFTNYEDFIVAIKTATGDTLPYTVALVCVGDHFITDEDFCNFLNENHVDNWVYESENYLWVEIRISSLRNALFASGLSTLRLPLTRNVASVE